jgi:hypothetical protein
MDGGTRIVTDIMRKKEGKMKGDRLEKIKSVPGV